MMLSIIIPTYNRINELNSLFKSLLKQTKLPEEIIIVDDSDGWDIQQFVESMHFIFANKNIALNYIRNMQEKSLTIARNIGIRNASSDIILFLDDDVLLDDNYLEEILNIYKKNPDACGVQGFIQNVKVKDKSTVNRIKILINKLFYFNFNEKNSCILLPSTNTVYPSDLDEVITCEWLSGSNQSYTRKILNEFNFDENLKRYSFNEDTDISYRIFKKYPNSLFITPYAKLIHKTSQEGRLPKKESIYMRRVYSLYFFYKNIDQSYKNKIILVWSESGYLIRNICEFILNPSKLTFLNVIYLVNAIILNINHITEIRDGRLKFFNKMLYDKR